MDILTEYSGVVYSGGDDGIPMRLLDYAYYLDNSKYLVGHPVLKNGDGFGAKVNCGKPYFKANAEFVYNRETSTVYIRCIRFIPEGGEVYISYGSGFWNRVRAAERKLLTSVFAVLKVRFVLQGERSLMYSSMHLETTCISKLNYW